MSYAKKNLRNVVGSIVGAFVVAAIAIWQFYLFATFDGAQGSVGTGHLWWAIGLTIMAFGAAFLIFSIFLRHDSDDDLHITFAPTPRRR